MDKLYRYLAIISASLILAACGGGGSGPGPNGNGTTSPNVATSPDVAAGPSVVELDNTKATLTVQMDKTTFQPAMIGDLFVHLSDGTREVFIDKKNVVKVFYNGADVGWHSSDASKGLDLKYDGAAGPVFTMAGQPLSSVFGANFSFLTDDRRELSLITDAKWLNIVVGVGMLAERKADGLLYSSSVVPSVPPVALPIPPVPVVPPLVPVPVPVQAKTAISINTTTGEVEITPFIVGSVGGMLVNLVTNNGNETVLDANGQVISGYRITWNDTGDWYPAGGKIVALQLPMTSIVGAAKPVGAGAGMPYLVRPDGTFVSFNTDSVHTTFTVNEVLTSVNVDGQVHY